uniref:Fungal lipase-like domain-containing protein n=1 Tax=Panagrolaimus sp. ES5 TaxID=591445 RepID=A0AC34FX33_9BILA
MAVVRFGIALALLVVNVNALFCGLQTSCKGCTSSIGCFYNAATSKCQDSVLPPFTNKTNVINIPYDCPIPQPSAFPYSDDFGRNRAFLFSAASNGENSTQIQKCLNKIDAEFRSQYTIPCDWLKQNCSGYLAVNPAEKAIVLTFRGSKGSTQFYIEALNLLTYGSRRSALVDGDVFIYFIDAFEKLWASGIKADLQALHNEYPDYELWTFGHSLGGSLASLASVAAVKGGMFEKEKVKSVTMGQPRTGSLEFAISHDQYVPNSYRIVHATDLITKLPFKILPGQPNAYHHRFEVSFFLKTLKNQLKTNRISELSETVLK